MARSSAWRLREGTPIGLFDIFSGDSGATAANQGYQSQKKGIKQGIQATEQAVGALQAGQKSALGYLGGAADTAARYQQQALPTWANLVGMGGAGLNQYGAALGVPGTGESNFQGSPGYQWQLEQTLGDTRTT